MIKWVAPAGCDSWSGDSPRILVAPAGCDPPCVGNPAIINRNELRVTSAFGAGLVAYVISPQGITLIPISRLGLQRKPLGAKLSSGHPRLDAILGGGCLQRCD